MAVIAILSMLPVSSLVDSKNAISTIQNITEAQGTFRLSIAGNAFIVLIELVLVVLLYVLFRPVSKTLSLLGAVSRLGMATIQGVNLFTQVAVLVLVGGAGYLAAFEPAQLQTLAAFSLEANSQIALIWGIFFAMHLVVTGYMAVKSQYLPKLVGWVLMLSGALYGVQSFGMILYPQGQAAFETLGYISIIELVFPLWLLVRGVRASEWERAINPKTRK
jgi:hypothetical protein